MRGIERGGIDLDFRERLRSNKIILFDGAMGTELARRGLEMSGINNLSNPEQVLQIHQDYIRAGAEALITNTCTMNRINVESHGIAVDLEKVNLAGVRLAREAAGGAFVFGDISSTGQLLKPYGSYSEVQFYETFREQAALLAEGGVDGFIIETMFDLREALCALRACKDISALPVIVTLSFSKLAQGGRTIMGDRVGEIAQALEAEGADAVGANCGDLDPAEMAGIAALYREATALPVLIQPNAGKPKLVQGETAFDMNPEEFAGGLLRCLDSGATLIGGCCGTGPEHIRLIGERLKDR